MSRAEDISESALRRVQEHSNREAEELLEYLQQREDSLQSELRSLREREVKFQKELKKREAIFSEREKTFSEMQSQFQERLAAREREVEVLQARLHHEIGARERDLDKARVEFEREKARYLEENQGRIQEQSQEYVAEALAILEKKESDFHDKSRLCSWIGAGSLGAVLLFFLFLTIFTTYNPPDSVSWQDIAYLLVKGVVVVALFGALAKYAHGFSTSYMHEALKNADRRHAINFGKFYLRSFGASADWSEVKEAFEHWNITQENAFTNRGAKAASRTDLEDLKGLVEKVTSEIDVLRKKRDA